MAARARIVPFGLYVLLLVVGQAIGWLEKANDWPPSLIESIQLWLYPIKTVTVVAALAWYWRQYDELRWPPRLSWRLSLLSLAVGLVVYLAWVRMDWSWAMQGPRSSGYNPFSSQSVGAYGLAAVRLFGAAIVVPVMEELFWRSFLMRYLISVRFDTVRIGAFTPFSFFLMVVLFGVEHDLWLAGMMAGAAYGLVLIGTRSLWGCIGAHAITNFALGIHVISTGQWYWW